MTDSNSPPSFDAIFSSQEPPRRSSSNSSSFNAYSYGNPSHSHYNADQTHNSHLVDEPQSLHRRPSNASLQGQGQVPGRERASSSASVTDMMARGFNMDGTQGAHGRPGFHRRQSSLRKESLPFNPEADSTLIATASRQGHNAHGQGHGHALTSPPIGDIMFGVGQRTQGNFAQQQKQQQQQQHHQQQQIPQHQSQWTDQHVNDGVLQQQQQQQGQYADYRNQPQYSPFHSPVPTPSSAGLDYMTPATANSLTESSIYDQFSPYSNPALTPNQQNPASWGQDFVGQDTSSGYGGNGQEETGGMGEMMGMNEQDALNNELQRIISNTSHHSSHSREPSREPSPYPQSHSEPSGGQQSYPVQQSFPVSAGHSRQGSFPSSRSPSPFAQPQFSQLQQQPDMSHIASPPANGSFQRAGSSSQTGSPFFNKPQSPPALIIPNQPSPSPVLPPIVTTATAAGPSNNPGGGVTAPRQGDLGGAVSGGLLPPANPALEHLTGMAGISPIAPSADGPMIFVQPSTPISGLKDGRGLFDAALRRAGAMAQQGGQNSQQQAQHDRSQHQQQQAFNVPPPQSHPLSQPAPSDQLAQAGQNDSAAHAQAQMDFAAAMALQATQGWGQQGAESLRVAMQTRPRAKSDSFMPSPTADSFDRQALLNLLAGSNTNGGGLINAMQDPGVSEQWRNTVNAWRTGLDDGDQSGLPNASIDPRMLPGQDGQDPLQLFMIQQHQQQATQDIDTSQAHQLSQLQAQRNRLPPLNTNPTPNTASSSGEQGGVFKYEPGEFSPTSMAFYQSIGLYPHSASELHGTTSAPFYTTTFGDISGTGIYPNVVGPGSTQSYLAPNQAGVGASGDGNGAGGSRRRSFGAEVAHPAAGAGTPGYGVEFTSNTSPFGQLRPGQVRGVSGHGHRRAAKSEDFGRVGTGWGVGAGGSTADFLQSITANDGSLLPPSNRGRTLSHGHSRHSSASSARSVSPALSISSQGSAFSHHSPRMDMPEGVQVPTLPGDDIGLNHQAHGGRSAGGKKRVAKMKVTSVATEMASTSRRTNSGVFKCPVPGCGSTFTRHFNLKGHLRSHNDERPYKCLYDGCPKAIVGFARQHDCKRHMLLHEGLRPFECEGCGKKFARLDALTRHHKSEQGQECAITHPLPVNPDGTAMSESQYKTYKGIRGPTPNPTPSPGKGGGKRRGSDVKQEYLSGDDRSGNEYDYGYNEGEMDTSMEMDLGGGMSGMEDYDRM